MAADVVTMDKIVVAVQAARLRLPVVGDLRRPRLDLRLRPLRRAPEDERQERVVAVDARRATTSSRSTRRSSSTRSVWEASGHVAGFTDPLVDCRTCKQRFRADHLDQLAVPAASRRSTRASDRTAT